MSDFEDEAVRRSQLLTMLEGHTGPLADDDDDVFGHDELEVADRIMSGGQGSLEGKVSLRDQRWNDLVGVAPFARNNPPSVLKGTLGGQQTVMTGVSSGGIVPRGVPVQVVNWSGDDAETTPVSITLQTIGQPTNNAPITGARFAFGARPFAIVRFGTRGMMTQAEVDIGRGCQFTVSGSSVAVQVGLDGGSNVMTDGLQLSALLAGMLSFNQVVRTAPITRTIYFDNIDDTAVPVVVPAFAKNVTFWRENSTAVSAVLTFQDSQFGARYEYDLPVTTGDGTTGYMLKPIPLTGDIANMTITQSGSTGNNAGLIFELSL